MTRPPVWALVSSSGAVFALVGGWLLGAAVQPPGYDPVRETISALARHGATDRWIMTVGLAGLGVAHLVTAAGLSMLRPSSRGVLAAAGVATVLVAVFAEPDHGSSAAHVAAATTGFVLLALWPATTTMRATPVTSPPVAGTVTVVSLALLAWVGAGGDLLGLSERLLSAQQALWPLVVVVGLRHRRAVGG